jgi:SAM-dependent methyltransferase
MWSHDFFDLAYYHLFLHEKEAAHPALARRLVERFGLQGRGIDIGCGSGSLAQGLTMYGCEMQGLELMPAYVALGKERGYRVEFLTQSMLDPIVTPPTDFVLNYNSSWGYFSHEDNRLALARMVGLLKPGGRLIMELFQSHYIRSHFSEELRYTKVNLADGLTYQIERKSDIRLGPPAILSQRWTRTALGHQRAVATELELVTPEELVQTLQDLGCHQVELFGPQFDPYTAETSARLWLTACKK